MTPLLLALLGTVPALFQTHRSLALENLALRQQLAILRSSQRRPRLTTADRWFWVVLARRWSEWRSALAIVTPDTVLRWHREGFRRHWARKSRGREPGRPALDPQVVRLIRDMSGANPLWGAPRIHGELLKLGVEVSQATVSKYMPRHRRPPSQTWRSFIDNHLHDLVALDFFTVPTATFRVLFVLVILRHDRRRIVHFNVTSHPTAQWTSQQLVEAFPWDTPPSHLLRDRDSIYGTAFQRRAASLGIAEVRTTPRSPWENPYAERLIGSIRRECLDHVIVLGERHLRRILTEYFEYYSRSRTHLSLEKDAPEPRTTEGPENGKVVALPRVGGLHHHYTRRAA